MCSIMGAETSSGGTPKKGMRWYWKVLWGLFIFVFLIALILPFSNRPKNKARLLNATSNARQIHIGIQSALLDNANTQTLKGVLPADIGAKTNLEYVTFLVKSGIFKESDLRIFCKPGRKITSLKDLKADDLYFAFANLSSEDVTNGNSIFIVSRNWAEEYAADPSGVSNKESDKNGYVIFNIGGDGVSYTKKPPAPLTIHLPPREPKFLAP